MYRGIDNPETACGVESVLNDVGNYDMYFLDSAGEYVPLEYRDIETRKEAEGLAKDLLLEQAKQIPRLLGCEIGFVDETQ